MYGSVGVSPREFDIQQGSDWAELVSFDRTDCLYGLYRFCVIFVWFGTGFVQFLYGFAHFLAPNLGRADLKLARNPAARNIPRHCPDLPAGEVGPHIM